jgi:hypothetical protein
LIALISLSFDAVYSLKELTAITKTLAVTLQFLQLHWQYLQGTHKEFYCIEYLVFINEIATFLFKS